MLSELFAGTNMKWKLTRGDRVIISLSDVLFFPAQKYQLITGRVTNDAGEPISGATIGLSEPAQAIYYNDQQPDKIFYQGLALLKLDNEAAANERFNKLLQYGEQHLNDCVKIDFLAVSLPDLMIFDDDLNMRNKVHCYYLMGLEKMGKGEIEEARKAFQQVLALDAAHIGATIHQRLLEMNFFSFSLA